MNLVKRAWLRSTTHLGKTAVLVGLLSVICTMVLTGLMIQSAAARAADAAKASVGVTASVKLDLNAYLAAGKGTMSNGATPGRIGEDANLFSGYADRIGTNPAVSDFNYTLGAANKPVDGAKPYEAVPRPSGMDVNFPDLITTTGVRSSEQLADFRDGRSKLVSGEPITPASKGNMALVEERFAQANKLTPGGDFWLETGTIGAKKEKQKFTVSGIYRDERASNMSSYTPPMNEPGNNIYLTIEGASRLEGVQPGSNGAKIDQATFTLRDPADLDKLQSAAQDAGLDTKVFPLSLNDKQYQQLVGPIENTAAFASVAVWLVSVAGVVILSLIILSAVRDRRQELGILLSLGEPRAKLIAQLVLEVGATAILAIGVACAAAQLLAQDVASKLLSGEVSDALAHQQPDYGTIAGTPGTPKPGPIDTIALHLDPAVVGTVAAVGLTIALLATVLPGLGILRLRPRDILLKGL